MSEVVSTEKTRKDRLNRPDLNLAIFGLIAYFEDSQIRDRNGRHSSLTNSSDSRAASKVTLNFSKRSKTVNRTLPMFLKVRNIVGEWPSQINLTPKILGKNGRTYITVQDSNLFVTAFNILPLYYFSENVDSQQSKTLTPMIESAMKSIESFQRNEAFNFWPKQKPYYGNTERTGPLNIWAPIIDKMAKAYRHKKFQNVIDQATKNISIPDPDWVLSCMDPKLNPNGADTLFNIPNDADDSSVASVARYLNSKYKKEDTADNKIHNVLKEISKHRDINRNESYKDSFNTWRIKNSGAFLTWLKNESEPVFSNAENGVIPGAKNNVDIVVNANVLFAMSLTDNTDLPGYRESCNLLNQAILEKRWPEGGIYYPQLMMFPYAITRAIRDGQVRDKKLIESQGKLLLDILDHAETHKDQDNRQQDKTHPHRKGKRVSFPGNPDPGNHFSTALALNALLNIGENQARELGVLEKYQNCIEGSVNYLLDEVDFVPCQFKTSQNIFSVKKDDKIVATWEDGLFFSASFWDLAQWRSQAVTNASALEALSKYLLAYDTDPSLNLKTQSASINIDSLNHARAKACSWLSIDL